MKKFLAICLIFTMLLGIAACGGGKDVEDPSTEPAPSAEPSESVKPSDTALETIQTPLWTLNYDPNVWSYEEGDLYQDEDWSKIILIIPDEEDTYVANVEIRASIEDPEDFRDYLNSYGFDAYEYAVNNAYDFTEVGGVDCLKQEGNYWGEPCLRYFNRVEGAGATVFIEIIGEYEDERVDALLSGLSFTLTDIGNVDGPWEWEGEPFSGEAHIAEVGGYSIRSEWIPFYDYVVTDATFDHAIAVSGSNAYLVSDGVLKQYAFDGISLTYEGDIALDGEFSYVQAAKDGTLWISGFMEPLTGWKDGAQAASYEGPDYVAMHPSGAWGISWFSGPECEKLTLSGGSMTTEPMTFEEASSITYLTVDESYIYICGYDVSTGDHKVYVYDHNGSLQMILGDENGEGLGSITFITQTANGFIGLDGNMREVILWDAAGNYLGCADDGDLFGTDYPWFCGAAMLEDGSLLVIMTEDRADESAMELVAFKLSGF